MAVFDPHFGGYRIFVGDLGRQATRYDIEREYERYGQLVDVWVARRPQRLDPTTDDPRPPSSSPFQIYPTDSVDQCLYSIPIIPRNPPGFAFIVFKNLDECERAVRKSHGRRLCGRRVRVEYARPFDDRSGKQQPPARSRNRSRSPRRHHHRSRESSGSLSPRRRSRSRERRHRSPRRSRSSSANRRPSRFCRERNRGSEERQDRSASVSPTHTHSTSKSASPPQRRREKTTSPTSCSSKSEKAGVDEK